MSLDPSVVARVLGVTSEYTDFREGSFNNMPQHVAVIAQGEESVAYSTEKWRATTLSAAGKRFGWRSQIYLMLQQMFPSNGDGIGTLTVTVHPLKSASGATEATGDITVSGTASEAAAFRLEIGGYLSQQFAIPKGAVNPTLAHARLAQAVRAVPYIPLILEFVYGAIVVTPLVGNDGNGSCVAQVTSGSFPLPGDYKLVCNTAVANGSVWTLTDPNGTVVSTDITMNPGAAASTQIEKGGLSITLTDGGTDFAVDDQFTITLPCSKINTKSPWKGASANAIKIKVVGDSMGVEFDITQPHGGLIDPEPGTALEQIGNVWESMILNPFSLNNTNALDAFQVWGEGRWGIVVRKPCLVFTGNSSDEDSATAITSQRRNDRINCALNVPGSSNLPCVIAARHIARIAKVASENAPTNYVGQVLSGIVGGTDQEQWQSDARERAVQNGCSTTIKTDLGVEISDIVTMWNPEGEEPPAYRFVVDIVRLMNIYFNIDLIFSDPRWAAAPFIPDDQPTTNPNARKPSSAKTAIGGMLDSLADFAVIANAKAAKKKTKVEFDANNPKRVNITIPCQLSGNPNVTDVVLQWGFYFGANA